MNFFRKNSKVKKENRITLLKEITKTMPIKKKEKILIDAPEDACFWVNNGPVLKNLAELRQAFAEMTDEQFEFHAKKDENDFAKWVCEILGEEELGKKISKAKTKKGAANVVARFLK